MTAKELTLPGLFEMSVAKYPKNTYLWEKKDRAYIGTTYAEVREAVYRCAAGLLSIGIRKGDRIALISEGRNDWVICELGILYAGAINVPLSVKIEELPELRFRLEHSGCRMAIVSESQVAKVESVRGELPSLERLILLDAKESKSTHEIPFAGLMECGTRWLDGHRDEFDRTWKSIRGGDPANVCYTSGTVADPKGIILTHRNYTANVEQSVALYPLPEWSVTLLVLPWDHSFAHTDGIYALAATGGSLASVQVGKSAMETLRNIPGNIKEVRPTFLLSVPALARSFSKSIVSGVRSKGLAARGLFWLGMRVASAFDGDGFNRGRGWRAVLAPLRLLFDVILFRKIREGLGGRMQYFIGGGALLDVELQRFFSAIGIPMYQGYGLTEAAPVISANTPERHKFGTSGTLVPDLKLRICDEQGRVLWEGERGRAGIGEVGKRGEIVISGENVMAGYWRNGNATREVLREGWLHTGDLGYMDADGFLVVLGRQKSLLIGHDGEKYSPEGIEETIVAGSPFLEQMMLHNNQSPFTIALVVPNREALLRHLGSHHLHAGAGAAAADALTLIEDDIGAYREGGRHGGRFPDRWLPAAIVVLEEGFTEQNRLLNSTLKIVRGKIVTRYKDRIDAVFAPGGKDRCRELNRSTLAALLSRQA